MAKQAGRAISAARAFGGQCAIGLLLKRRERAAHPRGAITPFARFSAVQERDLADRGAS